jgi:hypothetical protein
MKQRIQYRVIRIRWLLSVALIWLLLTGCVSNPSGPTDKPLYYGYGSASTVTGAFNSAKRQILPIVVTDLAGAASVAANRKTLESNLYSSDVLNAYFVLDSMEVIAQGRQGEDHYRQIAIRVDLDSLARSLRANGVYGGQITPSSRDVLALPDVQRPAMRDATGRMVNNDGGVSNAGESGSVDSSSGSNETGASTNSSVSSTSQVASTSQVSAYQDLTQAEREIVETYIRTISFAVYFSEDTHEDPFIIKSAVGMANGYLADMGRRTNDLAQIEKLKEEQELVYEEQTGSNVGLIQWIAQKLNADVYGEIDAKTSTETGDGRYYGQANLTMKFFGASDGALLASVNYKSPRAFSQSSTIDAVNNALQSSVYEAMLVALEQLEASLRNSSARGIPYTFILQNTAETRIVREFSRKLEVRLGGMETISQSNENSRYQLYYLGSADDLLDLILDISDGIPAFSGMELVLLRGRELIFDTGM